MNKEVDYLQSKIEEINCDKNKFLIMDSENKYIFGIISPKGQSTPYSKFFEYKTIYDSLVDMDTKIKLSLFSAIDYAYSKDVQFQFNMIQQGGDNEFMAYYFIENALFRTASLWDILAQLYRLHYNVRISQRKVEYKKLFDPFSKKNKNFKEKARKINSYIFQKDNTDCTGMWRGNHKCVNEWRNKMTHRNSPNIAAMSDFDFSLKNHPSFMLKRIVEDYYVVSKYIEEIINIILKENDSLFNL